MKQRILSSINNMNAPEQISPFYQELANTETNNKLLLPIASYLATNAKASTDNIKALNTIISNKPSGQVLQEIYRHISPDALKGKK